MKVPSNPSPPSGGHSASEKDKTVTRRTVKGAAGGMKGVDYEDDRRPNAGEEFATIAAGTRARALLRENKILERIAPARIADDLDRTKQVVADPTQLVLEDEDGVTEEAKKKQRRRHVARDRFSVDKDAPELLRQRRWETDEDEDEDARDRRQNSGDPEVLELDVLAELAGDATSAAARARFFETDTKPEPGDPRLTDPDEIQAALGSPLSYAKHAMILAEAFRRATGATREEAIEYLGKMFVAPSDRSFGRLALKEFGPASGIVDVYPLEVVDQVIRKYPGFLPKFGFGRVFRNLPQGENQMISADTATPIILEYSEELKVRGFALVGGGRPGYVFEPDVEPGKYRLHIQTSGKYTVLISVVTRGGYTLLDRLEIKVRARSVKDLGLPSEASYYPERSEEKIRAWPIPEPRPMDPEELLEAEVSPSALTTGERVRMQQLDALRGPQPGGYEMSDEREAAVPALTVGLAEDDAEVLRLAVSLVLDQAELLATDACAPDEPEDAEDPFEQTARIIAPQFEDDTGDLTGEIEVSDVETGEVEVGEVTLTEHPAAPGAPLPPEERDDQDPIDRTQPIVMVPKTPPDPAEGS